MQKWHSWEKRLLWEWEMIYAGVFLMPLATRLMGGLLLTGKKERSGDRRWTRYVVNNRRSWLQPVSRVSTWTTRWCPVRRFRSLPIRISLTIKWWRTWRWERRQTVSSWEEWDWRMMTTCISKICLTMPGYWIVSLVSWIPRRLRLLSVCWYRIWHWLLPSILRWIRTRKCWCCWRTWRCMPMLWVSCPTVWTRFRQRTPCRVHCIPIWRRFTRRPCSSQPEVLSRS